jgi:uncharacterized protein YraI
MRVFMSAMIVVSGLFAAEIVLPNAAEAAITRTTSHLNMRFGPGVNYRRIATIRPGRVVNVLSCPNSWCVVLWRGNKGWVNGRYLWSHVTEIVSPLEKFGRR